MDDKAVGQANPATESTVAVHVYIEPVAEQIQPGELLLLLLGARAVHHHRPKEAGRVLAVHVVPGALPGGVAVGGAAGKRKSVLIAAAELPQEHVLRERGRGALPVGTREQHPGDRHPDGLHHDPARVRPRAGPDVAAPGVHDARRSDHPDRIEHADRPAKSPEDGREERGRRGRAHQVPAKVERTDPGLR